MADFPPERAILRHQIQNKLDLISATFYYHRRPIRGWETVMVGEKQDVRPPPVKGWEKYSPGSEWGGRDITNWFRARVRIPREMDGFPIMAILKTGGEALCYVDGEPLQGLDHNRWNVFLRNKARGGETLKILIEAYSGNTSQRFDSPTLAVFNDLPWSFYWDTRVALEVAAEQETGSLPQVQLLELIARCLRHIDPDNIDDNAAFTAQIKRARDELRTNLGKFQHSTGDGSLAVVSHSHIDLAWTWRLRETRRKVGRTWATVLHYMDQYPEVIFIQSQPKLYEYVKDHYPVLWKRVKKRIQDGRWEVTGPAWVEHDLNIPTGESHVRQYLYGSRFYRRELGARGRLAWMPDCFGFPHSVPQILKKAQVEGFVTWKLIFNQYQDHPYSFFRWKGIDGTEIPAISLPTLCAGDPNPHEVKRHWHSFKQKNLTDEFLHVFGHGDGGGGPTPEMYEYIRRESNITGIPSCRFGSFQDGFDRLLKRVDWKKIPVYNDELYLELHRGCQTSQARVKRNNRKSELLARDAEILSSFAHLYGERYPQDSINRAWKLILLNQFHDILPGSSIKEVYQDSEEDYATIKTSLQQVRKSATRSLSSRIDTRGPGKPIIVYNTLPWNQNGVAELELKDHKILEKETRDIEILDHEGKPVQKQLVLGPDGPGKIIFEVEKLPAMGHAVYHLVRTAKNRQNQAPEEASDPIKPVASKRALENRFYKVVFSRDGTIRRIHDKLGKREVLTPGAKGNEMILFEDRPSEYDAWEIDFNYEDKSQRLTDLQSIKVVEEGPLRATISIVRRTEKSTIEQRVSLWRGIPRIDFDTTIDWQEKHKLLKAAFPVDVLNRTATYEIQYGAIQRPTHRSTTHDRARFEVPAQRWIDLSETGYGVSLLNDSKYGFDVHGNTMRISLLRSPTQPDPDADRGIHEFVYSLYPHRGTWQDAETVKRAYELNSPPIACISSQHNGIIPSVAGFLEVNRPNVVIDWIKKAEDSDDLVMRLYESHGARGPVKVKLAHPVICATECDLLEENDQKVAIEDNTLKFDIDPWEIKTFKIRFKIKATDS